MDKEYVTARSFRVHCLSETDIKSFKLSSYYATSQFYTYSFLTFWNVSNWGMF